MIMAAGYSSISRQKYIWQFLELEKHDIVIVEADKM